VIHLGLHDCRRIDKGVVRAIVGKWRDLEALQLPGSSQTIDDECFLSLSTNLRRLRSLDLCGLRRLGRTMQNRETHILSLSSSLECLVLSCCEELRLPVLGQLSQQLETTFARRLEEGNLKSLASLVKIDKVDEVWGLLDHDMDSHSRELLASNRFANMSTLLTSGWKNLRTLDFSSCGRAGGDTFGVPRGIVGFLGIFSGGTLREVNVDGCEAVTDQDIKVLAATCGKSLTSFAAVACNIGDNALKALAEECENLASLDISECHRVTDEGVLSLCPTNGRYIGENSDSVDLPESRQ